MDFSNQDKIKYIDGNCTFGSSELGSVIYIDFFEYWDIQKINFGNLVIKADNSGDTGS
jgi:hypothetical protein